MSNWRKTKDMSDEIKELHDAFKIYKKSANSKEFIENRIEEITQIHEN